MLGGQGCPATPAVTDWFHHTNFISSARTDRCCMVRMGSADIVSRSRCSQAPKLCSNIFCILFLSLLFLLKLRISIPNFIAQPLLSCGPCSLCMTLKLIWVTAVFFHLQPYAYACLHLPTCSYELYLKQMQHRSCLQQSHLGFAPLPQDSRSAVARCLGILVQKERGSGLPQSADKVFRPTAGL